MKELEFVKTTARGEKNKLVRLAQEWLCLNGSSVMVDGDYGPGTELAVLGFQKKAKLATTGQVDQPTWEALVAPMRTVLQPLPAGSKSLRQLVVAYAERHLAQHPREVGGENSGPWVRLYMNNNEGPAWPWCAGFATFVLKQASDTLGVPAPLPRVFGCDSLAGIAQTKGILLQTKTAADFAKVAAGTLFLVRKSPFHWQHIGIVAQVQGDAMTTIEGNTNDDGVPEGFEVCRRSRGLKDRDFLLV
ncbi:MAG: peptidoglycan-binding protein [Bryobacterales bacterium]|nr:peptidoglycan-binding protein [Bryobacterales bacterium]